MKEKELEKLKKDAQHLQNVNRLSPA
jgi:hypothetical protein